MRSRLSTTLFVATVLAGLTACGRADAPTAAPEPDAAAAGIEATPSTGPIALPRSPSPGNARVVLVSPTEGDVVSSPVKVAFELQGMTLAPAGDATPNSGHHHLLIDAEPTALDAPILKDAQHLHFGLGQSEADIELPPGTHRLQLLLGDANHIPHDPPVKSGIITITVQ